MLPVFGVVLDLADVEQEPDASDVALGSWQVESSPAVVVTHVHVHALVVGTAIFLKQVALQFFSVNVKASGMGNLWR